MSDEKYVDVQSQWNCTVMLMRRLRTRQSEVGSDKHDAIEQCGTSSLLRGPNETSAVISIRSIKPITRFITDDSLRSTKETMNASNKNEPA